MFSSLLKRALKALPYKGEIGLFSLNSDTKTTTNKMHMFPRKLRKNSRKPPWLLHFTEISLNSRVQPPEYPFMLSPETIIELSGCHDHTEAKLVNTLTFPKNWPREILFLFGTRNLRLAEWENREGITNPMNWANTGWSEYRKCSL